MKRVIGLLALAVLLATPSPALAGQTGMYIAPKFSYGYALMEDYQVEGWGFVNITWDNIYMHQVLLGLRFAF